MKAKFINEIEFNFSKNPTDQFRGGFKKGVSGDPAINPRKAKYNYTDEEKEIASKHHEKIDAVRNEIYDFEGEIEGLEYELESIKTDEHDPADLEMFYGDIQQDFGTEGLDLLNSGYSLKEKVKGLDEIEPGNDKGIDSCVDAVREYEYFHPGEPGEEELQKIDAIEKKIKKLKTFIQERENTLEKLETKIYNLETY